MRLLSLLALASVLLLPLGAQAQWQWVDKDHKKVFSDQPPPPDIPDESILRRPAAQPRRAATAPAADLAPAATLNAPAPALSAAPKGVDKSLEEKARQVADADKAKAAAEADKQAKAKADNCARARESKATLDSGLRMAQLNDQGERIVLDDAARAAETKRVQSVISADCQ